MIVHEFYNGHREKICVASVAIERELAYQRGVFKEKVVKPYSVIRRENKNRKTNIVEVENEK